MTDVEYVGNDMGICRILLVDMRLVASVIKWYIFHADASFFNKYSHFKKTDFCGGNLLVCNLK